MSRETQVGDPYDVLGVPHDASDAQIRFAYRQALRETSADGSEEAKERIHDIEQAYKVLSDPRRRRAYGEAGTPPAPEVAEAPAAAVATEEPPPRNPFTRLTHRLPRPYRIAIDWVLTIAGAVGIVLAIKAWVVNPYRIPSSSMEPTLHCARPGSGCEAHYSDRVLANRFIYHLRNPERGEIVVFNTPPAAETKCGAGGTFVKRLIGLPGDTIRERSGYFYINGKKLNDGGYVKAGRRDTESGKWLVPKGDYFFVGDNRSSSCDSRRWGSVPRGNLIGPVFAIYWPPNRISLNTPGPIGAGILGGLGLIIALLIALAVRRRLRRREQERRRRQAGPLEVAGNRD
jgi:signal peptidase I